MGEEIGNNDDGVWGSHAKAQKYFPEDASCATLIPCFCAGSHLRVHLPSRCKEGVARRH